MKYVRDTWPVVVIVATIAAAAWTAAWNVRDFFPAQITAVESRFTAQVAASEARLAAQIAASETRLTAQIAENRAQIAENRAQIAELRRLFVDHLEDHANAR